MQDPLYPRLLGRPHPSQSVRLRLPNLKVNHGESLRNPAHARDHGGERRESSRPNRSSWGSFSAKHRFTRMNSDGSARLSDPLVPTLEFQVQASASRLGNWAEVVGRGRGRGRDGNGGAWRGLGGSKEGRARRCDYCAITRRTIGSNGLGKRESKAICSEGGFAAGRVKGLNSRRQVPAPSSSSSSSPNVTAVASRPIFAFAPTTRQPNHTRTRTHNANRTDAPSPPRQAQPRRRQ